MEKTEFLNKIRLQKGLHSYYEMRKKPFAIASKILMIVVPAVIAFLSIANIDILRLFIPRIDNLIISAIISMISLFLFVFSVLIDLFGINVNYKQHRMAINQLIKLRTNFQNEIEVNPENENDVVRKYNDIYSEIVTTLPEFTDKQYKKGKEYYIKRLSEKEELNRKLEGVNKN